MSEDVKLTPEQAGVLACINCIDQILQGLEVGAGSHDWGSFRQGWVTNSDEQVQAIFEKAAKENRDQPEQERE